MLENIYINLISFATYDSLPAETVKRSHFGLICFEGSQQRVASSADDAKVIPYNSRHVHGKVGCTPVAIRSLSTIC